MQEVVNIYFVSSPLQYLASKAIADTFERNGRQILIWYKPGVGPVVIREDWDAIAYMPWPRLEPLPGLFGRQRRLIENIEMVAALAGTCDVLQIHSAVFDTEAINYFLKALPSLCGARHMSARILPDGIISIRRYPLNILKRFLQQLKRVRRFIDPRLSYWPFTGDRIGSDAPFCDRIYVMPGLPHEYPAEKVSILPPLVKPLMSKSDTNKTAKRALVVGQPLVTTGLIAESSLPIITDDIFNWLVKERFDIIEYKGHPKDKSLELCRNEYTVLEFNEPLENWMSKTRYDAVIGVRSSALLFARQIYPPDTKVIAFGWSKVKFKSKNEYDDMFNAFKDIGISFV